MMMCSRSGGVSSKMLGNGTAGREQFNGGSGESKRKRNRMTKKGSIRFSNNRTIEENA